MEPICSSHWLNLHIRPSPFAISDHTLPVFLSLSNSFLSVSTDDYALRVSSQCGKFSMLVHIVRNVSFWWFVKTWDFRRPELEVTVCQDCYGQTGMNLTRRVVFLPLNVTVGSNQGRWRAGTTWHIWGAKRNEWWGLVGKSEGRRPLGRPTNAWVDDTKMDLKGIVCQVGKFFLFGRRQECVAGCCECGCEHSGSVKNGEFLD